MPDLKVVHKPPGYEAWKDEKTIPRPNWRLIMIFIVSVFSCGFVCALGSLPFLLSSQPTPLPTLVAFEPTAKATQATYNVLVSNDPAPTFTPQPTEAKPNLQATLDYMLSQRPTVPPPKNDRIDLQATLDYMVSQRPTVEPIAVETSEPIFCDGAEFQSYAVGAVLRVTFDEKSALRLLDNPRVPDGPEPISQRLLYDGWQVEIEGEPVCGAWRGQPLVYYPVYSTYWKQNGWVGFGEAGNVWLEAVR